MKRLLICLVLLASFAAVAQEKYVFKAPDYKAIEQSVKKKNSPMAFCQLLARYNAGDTTITREESRHIYYGYSFMPEYSPFGYGPAEDSLRTILKKDELKEDDYKMLVHYGQEVLQKNPVSIRTLIYLKAAYTNLNDTAAAKLANKKLDQVFNAIFSSGDGKSEQTAFYTISVSDEYDILRALGLESKGQTLIGECDRLELEENEYGLEELYFNTSRSLASMKKLFRD